MQTNYDDSTRWDESRKIYIDRYGYSLTTPRSVVVNAPAGADATPNKVVFEPTVEGSRLRVPGGTGQQVALAGPLVMNNNEIRLQGSTDSNFLRYNTTNSNVEIIGFTGTRILTGTNGATNASQFDANGLQSRKYARSSGAYSTNPGTSRSVTQNTRSLLFLGPTFNNGVSGSSWSVQNIDGGSVVVAPFAGTIRASARIYMASPNTSMQFLFFRIYHPTNDASYADGEEGLSAGGVSSASYDLRDTMWGTFVVAAGERIGIAADNTNTTKSFTVLDYHFEYIA